MFQNGDASGVSCDLVVTPTSLNVTRQQSGVQTTWQILVPAGESYDNIVYDTLY